MVGVTTPRDAHVPSRPTPRDWDEPTKGTAQVPAQVVDSARAADKVLYGPTGEVLVRIEDRKRVGFR
jgi:hypothetical protein